MIKINKQGAEGGRGGGLLFGGNLNNWLIDYICIIMMIVQVYLSP